MGRNKKKSLKDIVFDIYRELYINAEPSADFDKLLESADILLDGRKDIHYENYEIDDELMDEIVEKHLVENKLSRRERGAVKFEVYLGASPKTKIRKDE